MSAQANRVGLVDRGLELAGVERVASEQRIEVAAVSFGEPRGLGHVAAGHLEELHEVIALEAALCFVEGRQVRGRLLQRALDQRRGPKTPGLRGARAAPERSERPSNGVSCCQGKPEAQARAGEQSYVPMKVENRRAPARGGHDGGKG